MTEACPPSGAAQAILPPWRKRHPVLSRSLLYGLGVGLAVLLVCLFAERKDEDRAAQLAALQTELDGLGLVLATDPSGERVLELLDGKFAREDLPLVTRGRALRWRAMAWRAKAAQAADEATRRGAWAQAEAAWAACRELDLPAGERAGLGLEWAEARLSRGDVAGGLEVVPPGEAVGDVPQALLRSLILAQAMRLEGRPEAAVDLVRETLGKVGDALGTETEAYVGGREWTPLQVAVELANFATEVAHTAADAPLWERLRAAAPADYPTQSAAARGLERLGRPAEALSAWRAARRIAPDLARAEARKDPVLGAVDGRASAR